MPIQLLADGHLRLAGEEGFEPSYAGIKIRCLNQLGDSPTLLNLLSAHCSKHFHGNCLSASNVSADVPKEHHN